MSEDPMADRVFEAIGRVPRNGGRDPRVLPHALLDLPEETASRRGHGAATALLVALLALACLVEVKHRLGPPSAQAAPTSSPEPAK